MATMRRHGVFVTGTDTGIGKTMIASAVAATLVRRGFRVGVYKPVETGCQRRGFRTVAGDCQALVAAAGSHQTVEQAASYLLQLPAAPLVAAEAAGIPINPLRITDDFAKLTAQFDLVIVEGAGGLLVPIADGFTYLDLARQLRLPVLTVVGSRLGCINHALLTLQAIERATLRSHGYVVNCLADDSDANTAATSNRRVIGRFSQHRSLGVFPFVAKKKLGDYDHLADLAEAHLDIASLV